MGEEWRAIPGFPYEVSSLGRVRRDPHVPGGKGVKVRRQKTNEFGYKVVALSLESKLYHRFVHRLVAEAFVGPRPNGMFVNHKNGIKSDNVPNNLEYVTKQQNMDHAVAMGLIPRGEKHWGVSKPERRARGERIGRAVLTADSVREIKRRYGLGEKRPAIARDIGVSLSAVYHVLRGRCWRHV